MLALPATGCTATPVNMTTLIEKKPQLLDLSENKQCRQQATKACQTEVTLCHEIWSVCVF